MRPSTKQIALRMLDFTEPLRPVIALNDKSNPVIRVLTGYDLNSSRMSSSNHDDDVTMLEKSGTMTVHEVARIVAVGSVVLNNKIHCGSTSLRMEGQSAGLIGNRAGS